MESKIYPDIFRKGTPPLPPVGVLPPYRPEDATSPIWTLPELQSIENNSP